MSEQHDGPSSDPVFRQEVRDTQKERDRRLVSDTLAVMSSGSGQRFLAWLLDDCGLLRTRFIEAAREAAFQEGRRSVASQLCGVAIACDPKHWRAIEDEMIARRIVPTNKPKEIVNE